MKDYEQECYFGWITLIEFEIEHFWYIFSKDILFTLCFFKDNNCNKVRKKENEFKE